MPRHLIGAIVISFIGFAAQAQPPPSNPISPAQPEAARTGDPADVSATLAAFRPGMLVKDASGVTVGPIRRVGQTADGAAAVEVELDGRAVSLSPHILTVNETGDGALSSMTKAEIKAASARSSD
jgi:hypothetical protein